MAFADNKIARRKAFHVIADKIDHADKFMADRHRHRNRFLRPGVPVIYVDVSPADGCLHHADEQIICAGFGNGNLLEPQPRLGPAFHDCLHRFLHKKEIRRIMKAGKKEKLDSSLFGRGDCTGTRWHLPSAANSSAFACVICRQSSCLSR